MFPIFLVLFQIFGFCFSSSFVDENNFFAELNRPDLGRPTKVIVDEIVTRSVSFPAKGRHPLADFRNPLTDYRTRDHPPAPGDFMLTNRRRGPDNSNNNDIDIDANNYQLEGKAAYYRYSHFVLSSEAEWLSETVELKCTVIKLRESKC